MNPTIGSIVHYQLSDEDARQINRRRLDFANARSATAGTGFIGHVGNQAEAGQVCPAMVVRTFGGSSANLQVMLDGSDTYWATSRGEGDLPGQWTWPPRIS